MMIEEGKVGKGTKIESTAIIQEDCEIGENCFIGHYVVMRPGTKIGNDTMIAHHVIFEGNTKIGSGVLIHDHSQITRSSIVEDKVFIGPGVQTCNDRLMVHQRRHVKPFKEEGVIFRHGCRVATGCIILPGVEIGKNAMVGAGSLVTKSVPENALVYGSPARERGVVPEEMRI